MIIYYYYCLLNLRFDNFSGSPRLSTIVPWTIVLRGIKRCLAAVRHPKIDIIHHWKPSRSPADILRGGFAVKHLHGFEIIVQVSRIWLVLSTISNVGGMYCEHLWTHCSRQNIENSNLSKTCTHSQLSWSSVLHRPATLEHCTFDLQQLNHFAQWMWTMNHPEN